MYGSLVKRQFRSPCREHALARFEAVTAQDRRLRLLVKEVVDAFPVVALQEEDVPKPFGRHESDQTALAFEHCIRGHRGAMGEIFDLAEIKPCGAQCVEHPDFGRVRRAWHLDHPNALPLERDKIRERASDLYANLHRYSPAILGPKHFAGVAVPAKPWVNSLRFDHIR